MFNVSSIRALRPPVDFATNRDGAERAPDEALLQPDRVTLSSEARRQLQRVEEVVRIGGQAPRQADGDLDAQAETAGEAATEAPGGAAAGEQPATTGARAGSAQGPGRTSELTPEQQHQVTELKQRDAHVRQHEAAHQAAGGELTGPASFTYRTGPDGRAYAVGGEVQVQSRGGRTPDETIAVARRVRAAALAPTDPSSADLSAAAAATQVELQAAAQRRQQQSSAGRAPGAPGAPRPPNPTSTPAVSLERLIVRAPEAEPFM